MAIGPGPSLRVMEFVLRLLVGGVLLVAGVSKVLPAPQPQVPPSVRQVSMVDQMLPPGSVLRYLLAGGEIVLGTWLILGMWKSGALATCLIVLVGFTVVLVVELLSDNPRWCGCLAIVTPDFTLSPRQQLTQSVIRNLMLMALCVWLWLISPKDTRSSNIV